MKIVAHRGYSHKYVENTLEAFKEAVNVGVDMIEMDVRLSLDGIPVIFHDDNLKRLSGQKLTIETMTFDEIKHVEIGLKGKGAGKIPSLEEVIQMIQGGCHLILEVKERDNIVKLCQAIEQQIKEELDWIEVSCFTDQVLETMHDLNEKINLHKLIDTNKVLKQVDFDDKYDYINCFDIDITLRDKPKVRALLQTKKVVFWTVDEEDLSETLVLGLYGAMSDDPKGLKERWG